MGMEVTCPECGHSQRGDNHRGATIGDCPSCRIPMRAWTAGRAKGRYLCPWLNDVVTLGISGIQVVQPSRVVFRPGWHNIGHERFWLAEPDPEWYWHTRRITALDGVVLGPGCVVSDRLNPAKDPGPEKAHVILQPAPDSDPDRWVVNEKLIYRKCAACTNKVPVIEGLTLQAIEWTARRREYRSGRGRHAPLVHNDVRPHPAGTVACGRCDPRRSRHDLG